MMNITEKIARLARQEGIPFDAAAARFGRRGARAKRARAREAARLTAVRKTWAWQRDFE